MTSIRPDFPAGKTFMVSLMNAACGRLFETIQTSFGPDVRLAIVLDQPEGPPMLLTHGRFSSQEAAGLLSRMVSVIGEDLTSARNRFLSSPIYRLNRNLDSISRQAGELARLLASNEGQFHISFEASPEDVYILDSLGDFDAMQTLAVGDKLTRVELRSGFAEFQSGQQGRIAFEGAMDYENPPIIFDSHPGIMIGVPANILQVLD